MLPKEMYTCLFLYKAAEADYYVHPPLPVRTARRVHHRFKIDLYIFIYAYIKKEAELTNDPYDVTPGHPGPRGGGGVSDAEGGGLCLQVRQVSLVCLQVECQLIMSLLLTPYVEFFMLSFTSLLKTDRF